MAAAGPLHDAAVALLSAIFRQPRLRYRETGSTLLLRWESSAAVRSAWESLVSSGVKQPKIFGVPASNSRRKAAHICRIESVNPNSKMLPVMAGTAGVYPRSSRLQERCCDADGTTCPLEGTSRSTRRPRRGARPPQERTAERLDGRGTRRAGLRRARRRQDAAASRVMQHPIDERSCHDFVPEDLATLLETPRKPHLAGFRHSISPRSVWNRY